MKNGYPIIDSDGHIIEPVDLWTRYIAPEFRGREPRMEDLAFGVVVDGKPINTWGLRNSHQTPEERAQTIEGFHARYKEMHSDAIARGFDAPGQLADMDREGVDVAVLYPSAGLFATADEDQDPALSAAICRAYNDWLADFCKADPQRLRGAAMVPLQDIEAAEAEAYRAVRELHMRAVFIRPNPIHGRNPGDRYYDPLYAALQDLGVPLGVHEGGQPGNLPQAGADRYPPGSGGSARHICSHMLEQMLSCLSLIVQGTLQRFPKLEVVFLESGCGWVPSWLHRADDHYKRSSQMGSPNRLELLPSEFFKRQCYISTDPGDELVNHVIDWLGVDRVVFATDYPHPDGSFPHAVDGFLSIPGLSGESKRKILWDNAVRLYHLETVPTPG